MLLLLVRTHVFLLLSSSNGRAQTYVYMLKETTGIAISVVIVKHEYW